MCASVHEGFGKRPFLIPSASISKLQMVRSPGCEFTTFCADVTKANLRERYHICLHIVSRQSSCCHLPQTSCDHEKTSKISQYDSICVYLGLCRIHTCGRHPREHFSALEFKPFGRSKCGMLIKPSTVQLTHTLTSNSFIGGL